MKRLDITFAEKMLETGAVKFQPTSPFLWGTGWYSPIYIDNLAALSHTKLRNFVKTELSRLILENFPDADIVAGVATGAIAHGVLGADNLGLPFVYVRPQPKDHGLENQIEGGIAHGSRVVIVESTIYTGTNSARAAKTISDAGGKVVGVVSLFHYEFGEAIETLRNARLKVVTVGRFSALLKASVAKGYLHEEDEDLLTLWHEAPEDWTMDPENSIID